MIYDRSKASLYAQKFALSPNPNYYFFGEIGGDCTNFVSQCLHAGGFKMIYGNFDGWFYVSPDFRSASWSGVSFFRKFLLDDVNFPKGEIVDEKDIEVGDVVFLFDGEKYYHTLIVSQIQNGEIFVCAHSSAALNRPLKSYFPVKFEFVHIYS